MFSANVFDAKTLEWAEKWTSPRPPRERLQISRVGVVVRRMCGRGGNALASVIRHVLSRFVRVDQSVIGHKRGVVRLLVFIRR